MRTLLSIGGPLLLFCLIPAAARAQATGSLAGFITDDTGGVLPGVSIEATNTATGQVGRPSSGG